MKRYLPVRVNKFDLEQLSKGNSIPIVLPCTALNCTVLGYNVLPQSPMWRNLDWRSVRIDNGPHMLHPEASQYLHVDFRDKSVKPPERLVYRVRSRIQIGDKVQLMGLKKWLTITAVEAYGVWKGKWQWRYEAK